MFIGKGGGLNVAWKGVVVDNSIIFKDGGTNCSDSAGPVGVTAVVLRVVVVINLVTF